MNRAQSPADEAGSLVLTRRDLFTLLGSAVVLVACGGKSHTASPITASTGAPASRATGSGSAGSTAPPVASGGNNSTSGNLVQIGGPHATGADAMSVADAQREAQVANGHWQGGWHDATGASGDSDLVIAIDGPSRTAKATVSFGDKLFGAAIPTVTYDIDLLSFMMTADSYNVSSPQFGQVTIVPGGSTNASGTAHAIPGQPTIDHVDVNGTMAGRRVDVGYTVHYADGHSVKGTMAWTPTGGRATPAALGNAGAPTTADIASGTYAAGLLDGKAPQSLVCRSRHRIPMAATSSTTPASRPATPRRWQRRVTTALSTPCMWAPTRPTPPHSGRSRIRGCRRLPDRGSQASTTPRSRRSTRSCRREFCWSRSSR